MQFITNGPDIPDKLLQSHEEGKLAFFCGAGISYPAGLPGFKGLVEDIYNLCGTNLLAIEEDAFKRGQYDIVLELLERRLPGGRIKVRQALVEALKPNLDREGAVNTHASLLKLARDKEDKLRLVTTNFDRLFHIAAEQNKQLFQTYVAPNLPVPKKSRWDGVVYLHGLLPDSSENLKNNLLNQLIVSSGDFGLAYLIERWAARFVSDLLHNYDVCFVGYSINDPVLRYMIDAMAAERTLGENTPQAWAFVGHKSEQEKKITGEWTAKGVTPILYQTEENSHLLLHNTLHKWAEIYYNGILGKEHIIATHALMHPAKSTQQDDFVGRVLWALSDPSGLPAKRFAELNPAPPLDWLFEVFSNKDLCYRILNYLGFSFFSKEEKSSLMFNLVHRPTLQLDSQPIFLASRQDINSKWDKVIFHIACWLTDHYLDDPRLIIWIAKQGGQLHKSWARLIEHRLKKLAELEKEDKKDELENIRKQSPKAIPRPIMRTLWSFYLSKRVGLSFDDYDLLRWKERVKQDGLTAMLRMELRELLTPRLLIRDSFFLYERDMEPQNNIEDIWQYLNWDWGVAIEHQALYRLYFSDDTWKNHSPKLINELQQLLLDALDLMRELHDADDFEDKSFIHMQSISPHRQNSELHGWTLLIKLLRDAWQEINVGNVEQAACIAQSWFSIPYPTFKRLAFFAASKNEGISSQQWVDWLLQDNAWWLWHIGVQREKFRLLVERGMSLTGDIQEKLENAILAGPPRKMYREDLEKSEWQKIKEDEVWLHLAKLQSSGLTLGAAAIQQLNALSNNYPEWKLANNERDEFSIWTTGTGDPDFEENLYIEEAPQTQDELLCWLRQSHADSQLFYKDNWKEVCRLNFSHAFSALCTLAENNEWPIARWRDALYVWSEDDLIIKSWKNVAPIIISIPNNFLKELLHSVAWWLEKSSKTHEENQDILLELCRRILELSSTIKDDDFSAQSSFNKAINHPVGLITEALINIQSSHHPEDNEGILSEIKPMFTDICNTNKVNLQAGRVILSTQLVFLFRLDPSWTKAHLLLLLDWSNSEEARAAWTGFLFSPRPYIPLWQEIKPQFLETAKHCAELIEHPEQYAIFLTHMALDPMDGYKLDDFSQAMAHLPKEGLEECARTLLQAFDSIAEVQRKVYWKEHIVPFWQKVWPKKRELATPEISAILFRMILIEPEIFPDAFDLIKDWLQPHKYHSDLLELSKSGLCKQHPGLVLELLNLIIPEEITGFYSLTDYLRACLDEIRSTDANLVNDPRYRRLDEFERKNRL